MKAIILLSALMGCIYLSGCGNEPRNADPITSPTPATSPAGEQM